MKKRKVLDPKQLPTRLPIPGTIAWYLLLYHLDAPGWVWGACGLLALFVWIAVIDGLCTQETHKVWEDE